jgi:hypothetical protein
LAIQICKADSLGKSIEQIFGMARLTPAMIKLRPDILKLMKKKKQTIEKSKTNKNRILPG